MRESLKIFFSDSENVRTFASVMIGNNNILCTATLCGDTAKVADLSSHITLKPHSYYTGATDLSESSVRFFFLSENISTKTNVATKTNQREAQRPRGVVNHHIVHNSSVALKYVCGMSREASDYTSIISLVLPRNLVKKPLKGLPERAGKARTRGAVEIRMLAHKVTCNACKLS